MRTSVKHILQLAWLLYREPYRNHLRIGQILSNASGHSDLFYVENDKLIKALRESR